MMVSFFYTRINLLAILLAVNSPCKFIQSPMDFGPLNFLQTTSKTSSDFGRIVFNSPSAVLRPQSPREISLLINILSTTAGMGTIAAKGAGHSISGQAQALDGIIVEMDSLPNSIQVHANSKEKDGYSYADVSGGVLWIELLEESLKKGLAPRSWTDYLYLSIGGTLSNAGISGQTFKYGPQISNVLQLDVVTGTGELVTCSPTTRSELFYAVLGGLGQFGIITRARILLQDAPPKVKWVRAFYDDFDFFTTDQELLVSMPDVVDYVEGFMVLNDQSILGTSIAFPSYMDFIQVLQSDNSKVYYCIEFAIHEQGDTNHNINQVVENISQLLSYMPSYIYAADVSYYDFLNRVRLEEINLRGRCMWDVPHPWLNMFVPKSGITRFKDLLLETISPQHFQGPILIYPILKDKWDSNTSAVLPEISDNVLYIVGMLRSADPTTCSEQCLRENLLQNRRLADAAATETDAKQYLAGHREQRAWRDHFGASKWARFSVNKQRFDPLHILSPGQNIFQRQQRPAAHRQHFYSPQ